MSIDAALGRLGIQTGVCTSSTRPANPYEGQVIYETDTNNLRFWSGSAWESNKGAVISSAAPTSPAAGDIWYDSDDGRAYVYYNDGSSQQWVEFGAPPSGSTIALASYADSAARTTAIPSPTEADLSYLQDTNSVEVYDGSAWAAVAGGGVRTTYTPASYINITVGNGTEVAAYVLNGDVMTVDYVLVFGSTTSIDGANPSFALPSGYSRATGYDIPCGLAQLRDQGTRTYWGFIQTNVNGLSIHSGNASTTSLYQDVISPTFPFTWTTTDAIRLTATLQVTTT
jgi:hypothetical protein